MTNHRTLDGEIELWLAQPEAFARDKTYIEGCSSLLSSDEIEVLSRLRDRDRRLEYLVSHALVRTAVARRTHGLAEKLVFSCGNKSKPRLAREHGQPDVRFNLSHTSGLVACALAVGRDVGVDVENVRPFEAIVRFSNRFFHPSEAALLEAEPPEQRIERFWHLWVLKEAYLKAQGLGLSAGLKTFAFDVSSKRARLVLGGAEHDGPGWRSRLWMEAPGHAIGIVVEANDCTPLSLQVIEAAPFRASAIGPPSAF